ncbi:hypothetical protein GOP47_0022576 [Adiantum capillus-veneris]|uniref:Uracil-DNA glycosylase-like domain-containing protein n=1 Tax=Adiantum capillus-veneris TaxID=13818 RepID=A0A9D4U6Q7_ADICA|nr:hypothetical protein GOP47_0022576 [Adiantum capillus-veneris]
MAGCNAEIVDAGVKKKRRRSHASELCSRKYPHGYPQLPQDEAEFAPSSPLPKLDSFAFTLTRYIPTPTEERPEHPEIEQEDRGGFEGSATKKPPKFPSECDEPRGGKLSDVHESLVPSLKPRNAIVFCGEDAVPDFGEIIPGACDALVEIALKLVAELDGLSFKAPVSCVYNPLVYAQDLHLQYIRKHGGRRVETLLVGMNPGPFGMAQTGVPFGDSKFVRTFHGLSGEVNHPKVVHPKRPVLGLDCTRSEVSGQRLWGWAQDRFGSATAFFKRFWVYNYCPLVFMEASGKNRTPDKLNPAERAKIELACNEALIKTISILRPAFVVGVGKYAAVKIQDCNIAGVKVGDIMHPSPANPQANKDWGKKVEEQLLKLGLELGK